MESAPRSLLSALTTWNCWGVPFASPLLFHRFGRWRAFHDQQLLKLLSEPWPFLTFAGLLLYVHMSFYI